MCLLLLSVSMVAVDDAAADVAGAAHVVDVVEPLLIFDVVDVLDVLCCC